MSHHSPQQFRSARPTGHSGVTNPTFDELGGTRLVGAIGSKTLHHRHRRVRLVLYPGESVRSFVVSRKGRRISLSEHGLETTFGHIYIVGGRGEAYEAVGGPPGRSHKDRGGHSAGRTPAGLFTLGRQEHHTTVGWPYSSIPYGAQLRAGSDGFIEYLERGKWKKANGPEGTWTKAQKRFHEKDHEPVVITDEDLKGFHNAAYDPKDNLRPVWILNDFGEWAWNLRRDGKRTAYYIHTTPTDEYFKRAPAEVDVVFALIGQSHGCIHVLPRDRDEMMERGYLKEGIQIQIMPYGRKGPLKI